ncbi:DMT family transporter [Burkholderia gladioli]|uniref:DMT family transporter n=1 Tax=Burkholderia gladioli TaxID=28095 RepID=UPI003F7A8A3E
MSTIQSQSQSPSAGPRGTARAAGALAFTVLSWASAFSFIRIGLHELSPMQLAAARFATAAVLVLGWLAWRRPRRPTARDAMAFALSGLLGIAGYNALLNTAELSVAPGAAAFIMSTSPIVTAILSTLFLREKLNRWGWAGSLFSFAGIGLIASGQPGGLALGSGTTLILLAAAGSAVYFVLQRRLIPVYGPLACTAYTLLAGAVLLLPWLPGALRSLAAPGARRAARGPAGGAGAGHLPGRARLRELDFRAEPFRAGARHPLPLPGAGRGDGLVDLHDGRAAGAGDARRRIDGDRRRRGGRASPMPLIRRGPAIPRGFAIRRHWHVRGPAMPPRR